MIPGAEPLSGGFFADPEPQSLRHSRDEVFYYDASGGQVGSDVL